MEDVVWIEQQNHLYKSGLVQSMTSSSSSSHGCESDDLSIVQNISEECAPIDSDSNRGVKSGQFALESDITFIQGSALSDASMNPRSPASNNFNTYLP